MGDLWGIHIGAMGVLWGTYGVDLWGYRSLSGSQDLCMGLRCQTYGALWGILIVTVAAGLYVWGMYGVCETAVPYVRGFDVNYHCCCGGGL